MKSTTHHRTGAQRLRSAPAVLLLLALTAAGCSDGDDGEKQRSGESPSASPSPAGSFGPTDTAWVQLAIPMHDSALRMLSSAAERTKNPGVLSLAKRLDPVVRKELDALRELAREAKLPDGNPHAGHNMPGMVTKEELAAVRGAKDAEFDRLFAKHLREYLTKARSAAKSERDNGTTPSVQKLAEQIDEARAADLTVMGRELPKQEKKK